MTLETLRRALQRDEMKLDNVREDLLQAKRHVESLTAQCRNLEGSLVETHQRIQALEDAERVMALEIEVADLKRQLAIARNNPSEAPF